jgi:hypothetical protein
MKASKIVTRDVKRWEGAIAHARYEMAETKDKKRLSQLEWAIEIFQKKIRIGAPYPRVKKRAKAA